MLIAGVLLGAILVTSTSVSAAPPKGPLDHADYGLWRSIQGEMISDRGGWVVFELNSSFGDTGSELVAQSTSGRQRHTVPRGTSAQVALDDEWLICRIEPDTAMGDQTPGLGLLRLSDGQLTTVEAVASYELPTGAADWVAWLHHGVEDSTQSADSSPAGPDAPEPDVSGAEKKDGAQLVLHNLRTGMQRRFEHVVNYVLSPDGRWLALSRGGRQPGLWVIPTDTGDEIPVVVGDGQHEHLIFDEGSQRLAFLSTPEGSEQPPPEWSLHLWQGESQATTRLVGSGSAGMRPGWHVSSHRRPSFSSSGQRLYFGTAPDAAQPGTQDSIQSDITLDVWSWTDDVVQPRQLVNLDSERKRTYLAVVEIGRPAPVAQLADESIPTVRKPVDGESRYVLGVTDLPYRRSYGWDQQVQQDVYRIDTDTGERQQLLRGRHGSFRLSPTGRYVWWWDLIDQAWLVQDVEGGDPIDVSSAIGQRMDNELHDRPSPGSSYGAAGWLEGDAGLILYDRYDLWLVDPEQSDAPRCLTEQAGRSSERQFRLIDVDRHAEALDPGQRLLLSSLDQHSKTAGFWEDRISGQHKPVKLHEEASRFSRPVKADSSGKLLLRIGSFERFDDLWVSDLNLDHRRRISNANPQISDYLWGTAEPVRWQSLDGTPLQGILYKPEDFDPALKYPMITYFYERNSDYLHQHHPPTPHRSIIRFPFYTSRGYLVFVPDIPYTEGAPGPSAVKAIVPGVLKLIDQGFVDPDAIGL
ncbi:MAG: hypothetical protein HN404_07130, partial [Gemmatimonadetes bacterium]|nr:hypothetical protein [Gemmatimonadota bacterium]